MKAKIIVRPNDAGGFHHGSTAVYLQTEDGQMVLQSTFENETAAYDYAERRAKELGVDW
jgi:hypothetical protein